MAEAAGLAIGAVGLAGLFTTCVQCVDYINLGRNHGRDYEISMMKLLPLKARLSAWGESLLVTHEGQENMALQNRWSKEQDTVGRCLVGIENMFEDGRQMESKYGLKPIPVDQWSLTTTHEQRSNAFGQVEKAFKSKIGRRQKNVSTFKKTQWAIHDEKKFDAMISDLTFFISGLEDLSDRLQVSMLQQRLLEVEVQAITDTDNIELVEQASDQTQNLTLPQGSEEKQSAGRSSRHTYIGTIIKDRAKVLNGNVGHQSQSSHVYRDTQASDDAHVVQGDMSNEAVLAFFK